MTGFTIMAIAWLGVATWISLVIFINRKHHPKALFLLFFTEFWERFSYYGMRALLVLYMVKSLKYEDNTAYGIYAAYGALVYATPILGGLIAEKLFGYKRAIVWGAVLMAAGHFTMAFEHELVFFVALSLLIMGNGFFKPNISSFIGQFYDKNDVRKDSAYTIFYMGINAGAFLTPLTCGYIGEQLGWHYGFGLAGVGMVIGLIVFLIAKKRGVYDDHGEPKKPELLKKRTIGIPNAWIIYLLSLLVIPLIMQLIAHNDSLDILLGVMGVSMLIYLAVMGALEKERAEGQRVWVIVVLLLFTSLFWTFFELAGSAITLYTERNVDMAINGLQLKASMFQSVNPLFILIFAPAFTWIWGFLSKRGIEPIAPVKFGFGLLLLGIGFLAFKAGEGNAVQGLVPVIWLILAYLGHTLGELCLSPVGLSLVTKLAPTRIVGLVMGIWMMSSSIAHQAGKFIANLTAGDAGTEAVEMAATQSLPLYTKVFMNVGFIAIGAACLLFVISPLIKRWMHGVR